MTGHYKDPYEPMSLRECHQVYFSHCLCDSSCRTEPCNIRRSLPCITPPRDLAHGSGEPEELGQFLV